MRKIWIGLTVILAFCVILTAVFLLLVRLKPPPPAGEMEYAREMLSNAGATRADEYSRKIYSQAQSFYDSAMANWQRENDKFILFRDYDKVTIFAEMSARKALEATDASLSSSASLNIKLREKIDSLNSLTVSINKLFASYPLPPELRNRISRGKFLLREGIHSYQEGEYIRANKKITDAEYLLTASWENARSDLENYFKRYPSWKRNTDMAIAESLQNNNYAIIIDKFSRKCHIYLSGIKKYDFDAELGSNWVGDKRHRGDNATPEGVYRVSGKFSGARTKFYKALLIDYPNEIDKQRFRTEKANGSLPLSASIGELIEIHGGGGRGMDWTEGCIALTDEEMDLIYSKINIGTPVIIVGSTVGIEHALTK
jgi:hypothetical protein